jgi:hypothetical protein
MPDEEKSDNDAMISYFMMRIRVLELRVAELERLRRVYPPVVDCSAAPRNVVW